MDPKNLTLSMREHSEDLSLSLHEFPIEGTFSSQSISEHPQELCEQDLNINQSENRYNFETSLGEGAYGKVWKAKDQKIGRIVALKQFKSAGMEGAWLCQSEIDRAGRLDHPGIPTIYDAGQKDGQSYFTMKYVEGKTLKKIIHELSEGNLETHKRFPFGKRAEVMLQLLRTLCDLHDNNIVHRDIKPDNILVDHNGHAYLMDWGIALDLNQSNGEGELCGTPKYMSPEQCDQSKIDGRSDIYSLSATFYEFLSLTYYGPTLKTAMAYIERLPFWEPERLDLIVHPANKSYVPSEYRILVHTGLQKDTDMRYQNARDMLHELEQIQDGALCTVCTRTLIKNNLYRYMKILDWNPYIVVPITLLFIFTILAAAVFLGTVL